MSEDSDKKRLSRRDFLQFLGVGAGRITTRNLPDIRQRQVSSETPPQSEQLTLSFDEAKELFWDLYKTRPHQEKIPIVEDRTQENMAKFVQQEWQKVRVEFISMGYTNQVAQFETQKKPFLTSVIDDRTRGRTTLDGKVSISFAKDYFLDPSNEEAVDIDVNSFRSQRIEDYWTLPHEFAHLVQEATGAVKGSPTIDVETGAELMTYEVLAGLMVHNPDEADLYRTILEARLLSASVQSMIYAAFYENRTEELKAMIPDLESHDAAYLIFALNSKEKYLDPDLIGSYDSQPLAIIKQVAENKDDLVIEGVMAPNQLIVSDDLLTFWRERFVV